MISTERNFGISSWIPFGVPSLVSLGIPSYNLSGIPPGFDKEILSIFQRLFQDSLMDYSGIPSGIS